MPIPAVDPTRPKSVATRVLTPIFLSPAGKWTLMNVSKRVDPPLLRLTRGRISSVMVLELVLLTTTGAKSGVQRTVPLVYFTDGDRVILMASNYGGTRHPAWYHNIRATPEVTLYAAGCTGRFVAEETTGAERERLWELAKQHTRAYAQYEQTTQGREVPVVALSPAG